MSIGSDVGLRFKNRLVVPESSNVKKDILEEVHRSRLTMHPRGTKMYRDLKRELYGGKA